MQTKTTQHSSVKAKASVHCIVMSKGCFCGIAPGLRGLRPLTAANNYLNMQHFGDWGPHAGAASMIPRDPQEMPRFDYSRLGYGRFRHPNPNVDFGPRIHMDQAMNGMQPHPPPPFCPWEREPIRFVPFNSGPRHEFNRRGGRFCGPVNFRPPPRFAPYPRPEFIRRDCNEINYEHAPIPVWRQDLLRPNTPLEYAVQRNANQLHEFQSDLHVPDWHLRNENGGCISRNSQQNNPVSQDVSNHRSPLRKYLNEVPTEEIWRRQRQQSYEWATSSNEHKMKDLSLQSNGTCREDVCVHQHGPTEESPVQLQSSDDSISAISSETEDGICSGVEDAQKGEASNGEGDTVYKNPTECDSPQEDEKLAMAIKLFLRRHLSNKPIPVPEVRDNFYYIGGSLQVSIFGHCIPKCTRGMFTSVASFGVCFKKGNHLNCAGRLKTDYPQTPVAAELLAAERAILLAKHTVRANAVTIVTESTYLTDNVAKWKKGVNSTEAEGWTPETWIDVKHVNEIRRLCAALDGVKVEWTLGDLRDTRFKELQIAKNSSIQCEDTIQKFIAI